MRLSEINKDLSKIAIEREVKIVQFLSDVLPERPAPSWISDSKAICLLRPEKKWNEELEEDEEEIKKWKSTNFVLVRDVACNEIFAITESQLRWKRTKKSDGSHGDDVVIYAKKARL